MIRPITRIVTALRERGIAVSTAEGIDAARAMRVVGVESRETLQIALRATLAKGPVEQKVFDEIFEALFVPPSFWKGRGGMERSAGAGDGVGGGHGPAARGQAARSPRDREMERPLRPGSAPSNASRSFALGRGPDARRNPRNVTAPLRESLQRQGRLRRIVVDPLHLDLDSSEATTRSERSRPSHTLRSRNRAPWESALLGAEEERRLSELLPRLVERIRLRPGRRFRSARAGRVWLRGALRENVRHGGVPFVLPLRTRRPRRCRVLILVDVSWSVARAAGFFLAIVLRFLELSRKARVFLFVDRPVDATGPLSDWLHAKEGEERNARRSDWKPGSGIIPAPGARPFLSCISELPDLNLDAPSDYGRAFYSLSRKTGIAGRDTILVVLGDGRVNRFDAQEWTFRDLSERCREVIWLVSEPRHRWGTGDSALLEYLPYCDIAVESHDLEGLARGVREILRGL